MNLTPVEYKDKEIEFMKYWQNNTDEAIYVGFECVKPHYSFMLGNCTDLTGFAASGKTEVALEFMFYLSETFGIRHALYVPDIGNYKEIRRKLLHKCTGKTLNKTYHNYITEAEILQANAWIDHHFIIVQKKDATKPVSPVDFWEFVCTYKDNSGTIHTGLIDSWKNLHHEYDTREDLYNDKILSYRNELAEAENRHFFTIAHSTKTEYDMKEKKRRIPDANDIKGGGWFASGKVICTVDRPDKQNTNTDLLFSKVKPDSLGKSGITGEGLFHFDWIKSRFYELEPNILNHRFYAGEMIKAGKNSVVSLALAERKTSDEFIPPPF